MLDTFMTGHMLITRNMIGKSITSARPCAGWYRDKCTKPVPGRPPSRCWEAGRAAFLYKAVESDIKTSNYLHYANEF